MVNPIPGDPDDVATRIARQTLASRAPDYSAEVRRLIDAGREVIHRCGTDARPRVADIVAAAGMSNDAFYRHFASKDALVAAIIEDGTLRLRSYLQHQMAKEATPERQVRRFVEGVLAQAADDAVAAATVAVLWNAGGLGEGHTSVRSPLATLLHEPFDALGSTDAQLDATLVTHALVGTLGDYLQRRARPSAAESESVLAFCLSAVQR